MTRQVHAARSHSHPIRRNSRIGCYNNPKFSDVHTPRTLRDPLNPACPTYITSSTFSRPIERVLPQGPPLHQWHEHHLPFCEGICLGARFREQDVYIRELVSTYPRDRRVPREVMHHELCTRVQIPYPLPPRSRSASN